MALLHKLIATIVAIVGKLGYSGIVFMMFLESSFFPFPSEVVIPPAGYLSQQGEMNIFLVIAAGILGSVLGALFNYWLALRLGRPVLLRYGRYFGLTPAAFARVESYFNEHGIFGTFIGRLIPGIRQYISFPAGIARLPLLPFILATALGAGIWVVILAVIGYLVGNNQELIRHYSHQAFSILAPLLLLSCVIYFLLMRSRKKQASAVSGEKTTDA
ncbi:MAG TPA: DedA family protein [Proteobacteria bacterium]|nr:DedA family protein [Pseudomonadota bacterium]